MMQESESAEEDSTQSNALDRLGFVELEHNEEYIGKHHCTRSLIYFLNTTSLSLIVVE